MREARTAGKFDHINLVRGLDVSNYKNYYYFVMEYVKGNSFRRLITKDKGMEEEYALHICLQVARALEYAYKKGIVHRDIKPDNILVTPDHIAKVCDMGLAKSMGSESEMTMTGMMVGTPHYVAPEQARGEEVDARSDIYSLGATLYYAVTGRTPFSGSSAAVVLTKHLTDELQSPRRLNPKLSKHCCLLIEKMMAREPGDRYQSPTELIADMELVIDGNAPKKALPHRGKSAVKVTAGKKQSEKSETSSRLKKAETPSKTDFWKWIAAAAVITLSAGIVLFALFGREDTVAPDKKDTVQKIQKKSGGNTVPSQKMDKLEETFAYIEKWTEDHPEEYDSAMEKYSLLSNRCRGTVLEIKCRDAVSRIRQTKQAAVKKLVNGIQEEARKLAEAGNYNGAIAVYKREPENFKREVSAWAKKKIRRIRQHAEKKIRAALQTARRFRKKGDWAKGLAALGTIRNVQYDPMKERVAILKAELKEMQQKNQQKQEQERIAQARALAPKEIDAIINQILHGQYKSAAEKAARLHTDANMIKAGQSGTFKALSGFIQQIQKTIDAKENAGEGLKKLNGVENVTLRTIKGTLKGNVRDVRDGTIFLEIRYSAGGSTGVSTRKVPVSQLTREQLFVLLPELMPKIPDQWLVYSVLDAAQFAKDTENKKYARTLARTLEKSKGAELEPFVRKAVDRMISGDPDTVADSYWKEKIQPLIQEDITPDNAKILSTALNDFRVEHGNTAYAENKKDQIETLTVKCREALTPDKEEDEPEEADKYEIVTGKPEREYHAVWKKFGTMGRRIGGDLSVTFDIKKSRYIIVGQRLRIWSYSVTRRKSEMVTSDDMITELGSVRLRNHTSVYDYKSHSIIVHGRNNMGGAGMYLFNLQKERWYTLSNSQANYPGLAICDGSIYKLSRNLMNNEAEFVIFNPKTRQWDPVSKTPLPFELEMGNSICADLSGDTILVLGHGQPGFETWLYSVKEKTWTTVENENNPPQRVLPQMCYDAKNKIFVLHGGSRNIGDLWAFDMETYAWSRIVIDKLGPPDARYIRYCPSLKCVVTWDRSGGDIWAARIYSKSIK
mgnify:FL=1